MGRVDARVVDIFSTARVQLCEHSGSIEPETAMGFEASGRPGLDIRVRQSDEEQWV